MQLLYQTHSPFARKVLVFAYEIGLASKLEVVHHETSPTNRNDTVFSLNPLGKVPVLITHEKEVIFDSAVICSYLDEQHSQQKLIPEDLTERVNTLRLQALADGMSEAGILIRWEMVRRSVELRHKPFADGQSLKLTKAYAYIENNVKLSGKVTVGSIALATSLSWLEFRSLSSFRQDYPKLTAWYDCFAKRDSMLATTLFGDTHD